MNENNVSKIHKIIINQKKIERSLPIGGKKIKTNIIEQGIPVIKNQVNLLPNFLIYFILWLDICPAKGSLNIFHIPYIIIAVVNRVTCKKTSVS